MHEGFVLGEVNEEGKSILDFSSALGLTIKITWLRKRDEHLITYKVGGHVLR